MKKQLQNIGLDLAIFYGTPHEIFEELSDEYDEVLLSCDFDRYAKTRDLYVQTLMPIQRFYDSFLIQPSNELKSDGTPYKVFTPFYKSLDFITSSTKIELFERNTNLQNQYLYLQAKNHKNFLKSYINSIDLSDINHLSIEDEFFEIYAIIKKSTNFFEINLHIK